MTKRTGEASPFLGDPSFLLGDFLAYFLRQLSLSISGFPAGAIEHASRGWEGGAAVYAPGDAINLATFSELLLLFWEEERDWEEQSLRCALSYSGMDVSDRGLFFTRAGDQEGRPPWLRKRCIPVAASGRLHTLPGEAPQRGQKTVHTDRLDRMPARRAPGVTVPIDAIFGTTTRYLEAPLPTPLPPPITFTAHSHEDTNAARI